MTRIVRRLAAVAVLGALTLPSAAQASSNQFSIMMDDDLLVYRDDATRDATMKRMKALGADYVRVTLLWSVVAEKARDTKARDKRFRKLKANNPKAYPMLNWDRYDRLMRACVTLGIGCYINITGPGPVWGHTKAPKSQSKNRKTWEPKPAQWKAFVEAVGKRYSGRYRDENDGKGKLPRVKFWSLWNEPGQAGWLTPQTVNGVPRSPHLFRRLHIQGYRALKKTGHLSKPDDVLVMGELSPLGTNKKSTRAPIGPRKFIQELFCVDANNNPLTGTAASSRGCSDFDKYGPLLATAFAHHPYTKKLSPTVKDPHPDSITMANFADLGTLLDDISDKTGRVRKGMPLISTEFGYETDPPDKFSGVSLDVQAIFNTLGDFLAFSNERILAQTQFLLRDVPPIKGRTPGSKGSFFTYQSGLYFENDQPKPAVTAYSFPFLAFGTGPNAETGTPTAFFWGQLKFRPNEIRTDSVQLQFKPADGSTDWVPIGDPVAVTNGKGFFQGSITLPAAGSLRGTWAGAGIPDNATSREFPVS